MPSQRLPAYPVAPQHEPPKNRPIGEPVERRIEERTPFRRPFQQPGHDSVYRVGKHERRDDHRAPKQFPAWVESEGTYHDAQRSDDRDGVRTNSEPRSEEHTSELQSRGHLVCRLLLEKKKIT